MGKGSNAPQPPDPQKTAQAQTQSSIATAQANSALGNVNQVTPYGNLSYNQTGQQWISDPSGQTYWRGPDGQLQSQAPSGPPKYETKQYVERYDRDGKPVYGTTQRKVASDPVEGWSEVTGYYIPQYTAETTLSPHGQALQGVTNQTEMSLAETGRDQAARIGQLLGTPFNFEGIPQGGDPSMLGRDYGEYRDRAESALMERMNPYLERDRASLEQSLANQGLAMGSQAYGTAVDESARARNDARLGAIIGAGGEVDRAFNQDLTRYNAAESQRSRFLNEALTERNQPLNEISALLSQSQVAQPSFIPTQMPQIPTTDIAGMISEDYAQRNSNAQMKSQKQGQAAGSALATIGMIAAMMMSDENMKTDIKKVGKVKGNNLYSYRYKGDPRTQVGFMAQEVQKKNPDAVARIGDILHVDYEKALS